MEQETPQAIPFLLGTALSQEGKREPPQRLHLEKRIRLEPSRRVNACGVYAPLQRVLVVVW